MISLSPLILSCMFLLVGNIDSLVGSGEVLSGGGGGDRGSAVAGLNMVCDVGLFSRSSTKRLKSVVRKDK